MTPLPARTKIDPQNALAGTMMDVDLTIGEILAHAVRNSPGREIVSRMDDGSIVRHTYAAFAARVAQLAHALVEAGIRPGDRVASFAWNTHRHLELYYAVPMIGAVLHTTNIRLFPEQVRWVFDHADDRVIFVDASLAPACAAAKATDPSFDRRFVVMGESDALPGASEYEATIAGRPTNYDWPEIDERTAAVLCYTSATTGDPKGVVFTHRSIVLHALNAGLAPGLGLLPSDVVMPVVPMFHVNAWGIPLVAPMVGAKLVLPGSRLDPASLLDLIERERVTKSSGVPTVWLGVRDALEERDARIATLDTIVIGGSAVPPSLFDAFEAQGTRMVHAWGMTEMSPLGTVNRLVGELADAPWETQRAKLLTQGRFLPSVAWKVLDEDGNPVPSDGSTPGALWVRGPFVTAGYYRVGSPPEHFVDGYFHTGDVVTVDEYGYLQLVDRSKDLVKSGGEWISSVDLENAIMGHAAVREAAVIALPHEKWVERPVAFVALRENAAVGEAELREWIAARVARIAIPDRIVFLDAIPRTGVGKFLKRELRERYHDLLASSQT